MITYYEFKKLLENFLNVEILKKMKMILQYAFIISKSFAAYDR